MIAADTSGNFVVVWQQHDSGGAAAEVMGRRFTSGGAPLAGEFQLNLFSAGIQARPTVGRSGAGSFVVVWDSDGQDGGSYGIFGRRFTASGLTIGPEFQVTTYTSGSQSLPSVSMNALGDFVVAWESAHDGSAQGIFARTFSSSMICVALT